MKAYARCMSGLKPYDQAHMPMQYPHLMAVSVVVPIAVVVLVVLTVVVPIAVAVAVAVAVVVPLAVVVLLVAAVELPCMGWVRPQGRGTCKATTQGCRTLRGRAGGVTTVV